LRIDRTSDSVFVWHGGIVLKKGMACAGLVFTCQTHVVRHNWEIAMWLILYLGYSRMSHISATNFFETN
jgi:hypothetical protein